MKRSKLINVLVSGFFLLMVSIASVNTADAQEYYNIQGPDSDNDFYEMNMFSVLLILAPPVEWNPTKIVLSIRANQDTDNQPITGIQAWYDGNMKVLNGYQDTITLPYLPNVFQDVTLEGAQDRDLIFRWWLN